MDNDADAFEMQVETEVCAAGSVTVGGREFVSDGDTAYVVFSICHGFPVVFPDRGGAFHPATVAASWPTIINKVFNYCHEIRAYDKERIPKDRILGTVLAAEFPPEPRGGWKVGRDRKSAPGIRAVAAVHKCADNVPQILGLHQSGRLQWQVSIEFDYAQNDSVFALPADNAEGWEYVRYVDAPPDLQALWGPRPRSKGAGKVILGDYNGVRPVVLWGGIPGLTAGRVNFHGVGLVQYGAEPENRIESVLASHLGAPEVSARLAIARARLALGGCGSRIL